MRCILFLLLFCSTSLFGETRVLAISGSTREGSLNTQLLKEAVLIAEENGAVVTFFDLKKHPMPLYDGDLEEAEGVPQNAQKLRQQMIESDLVMIASPEYNGSVSAVLKNALDWVSRGENANYSNQAFNKKEFLLLSTSPGEGGGKRGLRHLRDILTKLGGIVLEEEVSVPRGSEQLGNSKAPYYAEMRQIIHTNLK